MAGRSLILASGSIYRKQLLEDAGYHVTAVASGVDEPELTVDQDWESGLIYLAQLKARAVWRRGHEGLVFAADTVSLAGSEILGKPDQPADARRMLGLLSGTTHTVSTGWCLLRTRDQLSWCGVEQTRITMRPWTAAEIDEYLHSGEWAGKCGAYGLQLPVDPFVTSLVGSPSNVIGVPLERLQALFHEFSLS